MSYHLLQDYDMALKILEEFRKTQQVIVNRKWAIGKHNAINITSIGRGPKSILRG